MTSLSQDNAFGNNFYDQIVKWVGEHLQPEDVFEEDTLKDWALLNDWYPGNELEQRAEDNGYVKADS